MSGPDRPRWKESMIAPGFRDGSDTLVHPGDVILSTFQVRESVARTDTGEVFAGWDMKLERPVAIKVAWRDPGIELLPEARRCAVVGDPGAVEIFQIGVHLGIETVIAERVEGGLLAPWARRGASQDDVLEVFRAIVHAVAAAHEAGIAVGEISGHTIAIAPTMRAVLGRLSMSQVPAVGPDEVCFAPEVIGGAVSPTDPAAAAAIDLYGLGCVAVELATGAPPFGAGDAKSLVALHLSTPVPRISERREDLPVELSDLVDELLAKEPEARPGSAELVRDQIDAIVARQWQTRRGARVLVIDDDPARSRLIASLARRAHPRTIVLVAGSGSDAVGRMRRDHPDLVFVDAGLGGAMNALEVCLYAAGVEEIAGAQIAVVSDLFEERDRQVFGQIGVRDLATTDPGFGDAVVALVQGAVARPRRGRPRRVTG